MHRIVTPQSCLGTWILDVRECALGHIRMTSGHGDIGVQLQKSDLRCYILDL